jgi:hypothetical protein
MLLILGIVLLLAAGQAKGKDAVLLAAIGAGIVVWVIHPG